MDKQSVAVSYDPQARKWLLTINNPVEHGLTHDAIKAILAKFHVQYYCLSDEVATTGTLHTHVYIRFTSPVRFSTLIKAFDGKAHIDRVRGNSAQNREYVSKTGKWANTDKAETVVAGSFEEFGDFLDEAELKEGKSNKILQALKDNRTVEEIITEDPELLNRLPVLQKAYDAFALENFRTQRRDITVTYIYGPVSADRLKCVYGKYPPSAVYRVYDYGGVRGVRFDGYTNQDVLVFDFFTGAVPLHEMLTFLGDLPCSLPARYYNRTACYTQVFILSSFPLTSLYIGSHDIHSPERAELMNIIRNVIEISEDGTVQELTTKE